MVPKYISELWFAVCNAVYTGIITELKTWWCKLCFQQNWTKKYNKYLYGA